MNGTELSVATLVAVLLVSIITSLLLLFLITVARVFIVMVKDERPLLWFYYSFLTRTAMRFRISKSYLHYSNMCMKYGYDWEGDKVIRWGSGSKLGN